jgi:hypothetical protein
MWEMAGPTSKPFIKAFTCAAVAFVVGVIVLFATLSMPDNPRSAGVAIGRLISTVAIPSLITGAMARFSSRSWSMWHIIATFIVALVIVMALQAIGAQR